MSAAVLISGSSSGFGRMAAETLARRGYHVFATMRDIAGRNAATCKELRTLASREAIPLEVHEMDVTSESSVETAVAEALAWVGHIDVVINNAGFAGFGVTEAYTTEQFQEVLNTNFLGVVRVNRAVLPSMRHRRSGLLIHVSSGLGRVVVPFEAPYCASKFALEALADCYRYELAPFGIDSVLVEPGAFRTPIFQKAFAPADAPRVADYGAVAEYATRVEAAFAAYLEGPYALAADEVVAAFVRLIETPAGQRPFRTLVGSEVKRSLESYNQMADVLRVRVAKTYNVAELLSPRSWL